MPRSDLSADSVAKTDNAAVRRHADCRVHRFRIGTDASGTTFAARCHHHHGTMPSSLRYLKAQKTPVAGEPGQFAKLRRLETGPREHLDDRETGSTQKREKIC